MTLPPCPASFSTCMKSSPRRDRTSTKTIGTTSSAAPNPRPHCGAIEWRSIRSRYSRRERDIAKRFVTAGRRRAQGSAFQAGLDWHTVKRIKSKFDIPLAIKGIATAEDARIALDHGVEWIYLSNHGGRQLDHGRGSMDVLPEVVDAVAGRAKIIIDGSFCRGTDIVKAIAAGADLVGIGRMQCFALAAGGEAGVVRLLELLEDEVQHCLGLLGVNSFAELHRTYLHAAPPANAPHVLSAFPLLTIEDYRY